MDNSGFFKSIQDTVSVALIDTTRAVGHLSGEDLAFQRSLNPLIGHQIDKQNSRLLDLARKLARGVTSGTDLVAPPLLNAEAVEDNWQAIVDVVDVLLEKADACLDEYTGVIKRLSPPQQDQTTNTSTASRKQRPARNYRTQDIPKPQLLFESVPTNTEAAAFKPLLRSKPHAITPLEESLRPTVAENGIKQYKHPYETEISQSGYPPSTYLKSNPTPFLPFDSTKATFVDTPEGVAAMLAELKLATEIAVDLEHHDAHSYIGLVSLMQISTRQKDWVVDTLKPWREDLQVLNEVFANPAILKIFHGAFMDILWLQRDLGLYVVGLFDTFHASRALGYPRNSLASLLTRFVNFNAEKQYQMADWRIRPLPEEMFNYARSDTHFLLYVYDNMRNELIDKSRPSQEDGNLIEVVLKKSREEALQRYERPFYDFERGTGSNGWYNLLNRNPALFDKQQFAVFRAVHQWRDTVARQEDESVHTVVPKNVLFNVAKDMPIDMLSLLRVSHPISATLRLHAGDLLGVVIKAKLDGVTGPEMKELMHPQASRHSDVRSKQPSLDTARPFATPASSDTHHPATETQRTYPCRTPNSQFWGPTFGSSAWQQPKSTTLIEQASLRLAVPLPQLTAEIFETAKIGASVAEEAPSLGSGAPPEHEYVKNRQSRSEDVFIVKEVAGTRKRKALDSRDVPLRGQPELGISSSANANGEAHNGMLLSMADDEQQHLAQAKAESKAERKAQKKLEKERRNQDRQNAKDQGTQDDETGAFDYASAPSVLHAQRENSDRSTSKKPFDPYSKSLDAPKGMRKVHKEIAGRSFTFKE